MTGAALDVRRHFKPAIARQRSSAAPRADGIKAGICKNGFAPSPLGFPFPSFSYHKQTAAFVARRIRATALGKTEELRLSPCHSHIVTQKISWSHA
jgi:hypothetical protein